MTAHGAALAALIGAVVGWPVPWAAVGIAAAVAVARRHRLLILITVLLAASALSARAEAGLEPLPTGPIDGWVEVVSDPRRSGPVGVRFDARLGTDRVSVSGHGPVAGRLDDLTVGDRVHIRGNQRPVRSDNTWARWRHQVGSITVVEVVDTVGGSMVWSATESLRQTLARGTESMDRDDRAVFLGMVLGDDRGQSPVVADDFRAAGLGHLLVVSGQNVAFVLAVAAPLTASLRPAARVLALCLVLGVFAAITRFEPSVLRAVAMAGVGVIGAAVGTPVDGRRGLSLAVTGLVLVDPFLARVLAFQLSAAATAGIVWLSPAIGSRVPGPQWFRVPLATTVAAQAGVAPLLVVTFGPMPLAALPANLLAGPVSGPIMVWGSTAGFVAGAVGGPLASIVHWPTTLMIWWVRGVAAVAAVGPQATVGAVAMAVAGVGVVLISSHRRLGMLTVSVVCGLSLAHAPRLTPGSHDLDVGAIVHVSSDGGTVVELDDPESPRGLVEAVRVAGSGSVIAIVATDGDAADARAVVALRDRYPDALILAPPMHRVPDARIVRAHQHVVLNSLTVTLAARGEELIATPAREGE